MKNDHFQNDKTAIGWVPKNVLPQEGQPGTGEIQPSGWVVNAPGNVIIDDDGIEITDGALVVSNPTGTVVIDGTSNMFKILATGTATHSQAAFGTSAFSATLPGLGSFATTPGFISYASEGNALNSHQFLGRFAEMADVYVAGTSGGSPTQRTWTVNWEAVLIVHAGSGTVTYLLSINNATAVTKTAYGRYYILKEASL